MSFDVDEFLVKKAIEIRDKLGLDAEFITDDFFPRPSPAKYMPSDTCRYFTALKPKTDGLSSFLNLAISCSRRRVRASPLRPARAVRLPHRMEYGRCLDEICLENQNNEHPRTTRTRGIIS